MFRQRHGRHLEPHEIILLVVLKRSELRRVLADDDRPFRFSGDGKERISAGGDIVAFEFHRRAEGDFGGLIGAGAPHLAVGNDAAEDGAVLHAGPGIDNFNVRETDALFERAGGTGGGKIDRRSLGGQPRRDNQPAGKYESE